MPSKFNQMAFSSSMDQNIEINWHLANKGNAIHQLADYLGMDISETMAFGDGLNDLSMVKEAGIGVAVSNACPEVLKNADFVSTSNNEDGVAYAIQALF